MIRLENLKKSYGNNHVIKDITCDINDGENVVIIGRSGSGKSTLLRCINRIEEPDGGKVWLDDQEITSAKANLNKIRGDIGMVFQNFNLFPHLSVIENITLALIKVRKMSKAKARKIAIEKLRAVGLAEKTHSFPNKLSGGQKQRVAIARALAMQPKVLLFDEPTSALDPESIGEVLDVMRDLAAEGMTLLIVTHEMKFAREIGTRMLFLEGGYIIEDGPPKQVMDNPKHPSIKKFFDKT